jgi:hypothetical protein
MLLVALALAAWLLRTLAATAVAGILTHAFAAPKPVLEAAELWTRELAVALAAWRWAFPSKKWSFAA